MCTTVVNQRVFPYICTRVIHVYIHLLYSKCVLNFSKPKGVSVLEWYMYTYSCCVRAPSLPKLLLKIWQSSTNPASTSSRPSMLKRLVTAEIARFLCVSTPCWMKQLYYLEIPRKLASRAAILAADQTYWNVSSPQRLQRGSISCVQINQKIANRESY